MFVWLVGLSTAQAFVWNKLYSSQGPLLAPLVAWINSRPRIRSNVLLHARQEFASYGVEPTVDYFCSGVVGIAVHHSLAFAVAVLSLWLDSTSLFRLSLTFEIGENLLHYAQMALTAFTTHRIDPWATCPKSLWAFVGIHHLIGLLAGSGAFLVASDHQWQDVRLYVCCLLGCVLPYYLKVPLMLHSAPATAMPSMAGKAALLIDTTQLVVCAWVRFYVCLPLGLKLTLRGRSELGEGAGIFFGAVLLGIAPLFFVISLFLNASNVVSNIQTQWSSISENKLEKHKESK